MTAPTANYELNLGSLEFNREQPVEVMKLDEEKGTVRLRFTDSNMQMDFNHSPGSQPQAMPKVGNRYKLTPQGVLKGTLHSANRTTEINHKSGCSKFFGKNL